MEIEYSGDATKHLRPNATSDNGLPLFDRQPAAGSQWPAPNAIKASEKKQDAPILNECAGQNFFVQIALASPKSLSIDRELPIGSYLGRHCSDDPR